MGKRMNKVSVEFCENCGFVKEQCECGESTTKTKESMGKHRREEIYNCIVDFIKIHKYSPTVREIGDITGLKSTSSVYRHMAKMQADGQIFFNSESPRTIVVPGYAFVKLPENMTEEELQDILIKYKKEK